MSMVVSVLAIAATSMLVDFDANDKFVLTKNDVAVLLRVLSG